MKNKKLVIAALSATGLLLLTSATLLLLQRCNVINVTDYLGAPQPAAPTPEDAAKADAPEATPETNAEDAVPGKGAATESVSESDETAPTDMPTKTTTHTIGGITASDSETLSEIPPDGTVGAHKVTLPPGALDWAQPAREPQKGDIVVVTVLGTEYRFEVLSVYVKSQPYEVTVRGKLLNAGGNVSMMLTNGKMLMQIKDNDKPRVYNLYFSAEQDSYFVQEINPDEAAPSIPTSLNPGLPRTAPEDEAGALPLPPPGTPAEEPETEEEA